MDGVTTLPLFPDWVLNPLALSVYLGAPTGRDCAWCGDYLPFFGPKVSRFGGHGLHVECNDRAVRFALKSSIRHRTNPATGYFPGWRTP